MKQTLYTVLTKLIQQKDPELFNIVKTYDRQEEQMRRNSYNRSGGSSTGWMSFQKIQEPIIVDRNIAQENLQKLMEIFASKNLRASEKYVRMHKILSNNGVAKLLAVLLSKCNKEEILAELTEEEIVPYLFQGAPNFKVVVKDSRKNSYDGEKKTDGKYDIYLEDLSDGVQYRIHFSTCYAKTIYLWFLLNPGKDFTLNTLRNHKSEFVDIYVHAFGGSRESCHQDLYDEHEKNGRDGFTRFWYDHKPKANNAIREALNGMDKEDWYIIGGKEKSFLNLPEDGSFIEVSQLRENLEKEKRKDPYKINE